MTLQYFLIGVFLGLLPETLYFTMFFVNVKSLKNKKIKLFLLIALSHLICIIFNNYKILSYVALIVCLYLSLKILYKNKTQIIDVFIVSIALMYVCLISYLCFLFVNQDMSNYYLLLVIEKILLFVPFVFKNRFNKWYKKYYSLWNRNDKEKRSIKSITLRNISLISLNIFIILCNMGCLYINTIIKG